MKNKKERLIWKHAYFTTPFLIICFQYFHPSWIFTFLFLLSTFIGSTWEHHCTLGMMTQQVIWKHNLQHMFGVLVT
jgi:hypothetical protein